jgi:hypothetical protein
MTVADGTRHLGVQMQPVLALRIDHTTALLHTRNGLDRDPHLRMLWQIG